MMCNGGEPPHKRRKNVATPSSSLWSLPDDVVVNCLARVSRLDKAALSVTSKSVRSLVASSDFDRTRLESGFAENSLYVCLRPPPPETNPLWYILRRRKTSDLIPIPSLPSQPTEASSVVVLDSGIYVIGGLRKGCPTSDVFLLDCRTHTWRQLPSMSLARANTAAGVVHGKIYVLGGLFYETNSGWGEVYDPKTQTWDSLPLREAPYEYIHSSVVWDQKVYAVVNEKDTTFYYSPTLEHWGSAKGNGNDFPVLIGNRRDWCMVGDLVCFITRDGTIFWCEPQELDWREPEGMVTYPVQGLDFLKETLSRSRLVHFDKQILHLWDNHKIMYGRTGHLVDFLPGFRLSNSGPNIVLFWDVIKGDRLEIWCAEISLERRLQGREVWGIVRRINVVMTVDSFSDRYKVLFSASVLV